MKYIVLQDIYAGPVPGRVSEACIVMRKEFLSSKGVVMDDEDFDGIMQGLEEDIAYQKGKRDGYRVHVVKRPAADMKTFRNRFNISRGRLPPRSV